MDRAAPFFLALGARAATAGTLALDFRGVRRSDYTVGGTIRFHFIGIARLADAQLRLDYARFERLGHRLIANGALKFQKTMICRRR